MNALLLTPQRISMTKKIKSGNQQQADHQNNPEINRNKDHHCHPASKYKQHQTSKLFHSLLTPLHFRPSALLQIPKSLLLLYAGHPKFCHTRVYPKILYTGKIFFNKKQSSHKRNISLRLNCCIFIRFYKFSSSTAFFTSSSETVTFFSLPVVNLLTSSGTISISLETLSVVLIFTRRVVPF